MRSRTILLSEDIIEEVFYASFPYDKSFIEELKFAVDYDHRNPNKKDGYGWCPENKRWGFSFDARDTVVSLLREYFPDAEVLWE